MKRSCLFLLALWCLLFAGCGRTGEAPAPGASIGEEQPALHEDDAPGGQAEEPGQAPAAPSLEEAVLSAIYQENAGKYLPGECRGAGCQIFETVSDGETLSVYALIEYIEYGFQDDSLVNISGTRAKALLVFETGERQPCHLTDYILLDSNSGLSDAELEALMAPLRETGKDYTYTDAVFQELRAQADACAKDYLRSIGREAAVCQRETHKENGLLALGVSEDAYDMLVKDGATSRYPDWTGTCEWIESGVRYVYRTDYDDVSKTIEYTKTRYGTDEMVEKMTFDPATGEKIA